MRQWIEPVTDRGRFDIASRTPKAFLHASDLNRIENNIAYLSERLNIQGYRIMTIPPKGWDRDMVPRVSDLRYICEGILAIIQAYHIPDGYTDISGIPDKAPDFTDINNIEYNIASIKALIDMGLMYGYMTHFTYGQLGSYTNAQLRMGLVNFPGHGDGMSNGIDVRLSRQHQQSSSLI
jgi:hypothetical protein